MEGTIALALIMVISTLSIAFYNIIESHQLLTLCYNSKA